MADRLLVALEEDASAQGIDLWSAFVAALGPGGGDTPPGVLVPADLVNPSLDGAAQAEAIVWANLHQGLRASLASNGLEDLKVYQQWGPIVARFSFTP